MTQGTIHITHILHTFIYLHHSLCMAKLLLGIDLFILNDRWECLLISYVFVASTIVSVIVIAISEQIVSRVIAQVHTLIKFLGEQKR